MNGTGAPPLKTRIKVANGAVGEAPGGGGPGEEHLVVAGPPLREVDRQHGEARHQQHRHRVGVDRAGPQRQDALEVAEGFGRASGIGRTPTPAHTTLKVATVATTRRSGDGSVIGCRDRHQRWPASSPPWMAPQITNVQAAPCQSPPSTIVIIRLR